MNAHLIAGIGCRSGVSAEQIDAALHVALGGRLLTDVRAIATIDAKAQEPGLLAFCERHALPLQVFTREQIAAFTSALSSTSIISAPSSIVRARFGIDGVCEPCALLASHDGQLIAGKIACDGVTVALASDNRDVYFGKRTAAPLAAALPDSPDQNQNQDPTDENRSRIASAHDAATSRRTRKETSLSDDRERPADRQHRQRQG
ncbi:cobalamin biosynthesis protein [Paraburkholderia sp.]|uniref:cobalamin biosynthesis protein n=1 Tax=Paraburkholderia sp. TaxID=1926495 RepID=UPI003D6FAE43